MAKAYLEVEMSKHCAGCMLSIPGDIWVCVGVNSRMVLDDINKIHPDCPLKPLPDYKAVLEKAKEALEKAIRELDVCHVYEALDEIDKLLEVYHGDAE